MPASQQEPEHEQCRRRAGSGSPAENGKGDRDQQDDLADLDDEDRDHLRGQETVRVSGEPPSRLRTP